MRCHVCDDNATAVLDSRHCSGGIRRRRVCGCGERFTTYEFHVDKPFVGGGGGAAKLLMTATLISKLGPEDRDIVMRMARALGRNEL